VLYYLLIVNDIQIECAPGKIWQSIAPLERVTINFCFNDPLEKISHNRDIWPSHLTIKKLYKIFLMHTYIINLLLLLFMIYLINNNVSSTSYIQTFSIIHRFHYWSKVFYIYSILFSLYSILSPLSTIMNIAQTWRFILIYTFYSCYTLKNHNYYYKAHIVLFFMYNLYFIINMEHFIMAIKCAYSNCIKYCNDILFLHSYNWFLPHNHIICSLLVSFLNNKWFLCEVLLFNTLNCSVLHTRNSIQNRFIWPLEKTIN